MYVFVFVIIIHSDYYNGLSRTVRFVFVFEIPSSAPPPVLCLYFTMCLFFVWLIVVCVISCIRLWAVLCCCYSVVPFVSNNLFIIDQCVRSAYRRWLILVSVAVPAAWATTVVPILASFRPSCVEWLAPSRPLCLCMCSNHGHGHQNRTDTRIG